MNSEIELSCFSAHSPPLGQFVLDIGLIRADETPTGLLYCNYGDETHMKSLLLTAL